MILVTVGSLDPFDRMIRLVDDWIGREVHRKGFAQIGNGAYLPEHLPYVRFFSARNLRDRMTSADAVVAHAGMGTVLTALEVGTPLLVFPRRACFGETRNDHQVATAERLAQSGRAIVAFSNRELFDRLDELERPTGAIQKIGPVAAPELIARIRTFVQGAAGSRGSEDPS